MVFLSHRAFVNACLECWMKRVTRPSSENRHRTRYSAGKHALGGNEAHPMSQRQTTTSPKPRKPNHD
jgi:hypothetical protein